MRRATLGMVWLSVCLWIGGDLSAYVDKDTLDGTWVLTAGQANGDPLPKNMIDGGELVLKGERYTIKLPGKGTVTGVQRLDASKQPTTIDITDDSGANKGKTCMGIYELKGDEFRVVFAQPGGGRPGKFATVPDSGQWMHVWKRRK